MMSDEQDSISTRDLFTNPIDPPPKTTNISCNESAGAEQDAFNFLSSLFNLQDKPPHLSSHTGCWDEYNSDINLRINFAISALQHIRNKTRKQMLKDGYYKNPQGYFYMCMFAYSQMHLFGDDLLDAMYTPIIHPNMNDLNDIDIDYECFNHFARMLGPIVLATNTFLTAKPSVVAALISRKILSTSIHNAHHHLDTKLKPALSQTSGYSNLEKKGCMQSIKIIEILTPLSLTCINFVTMKPDDENYQEAKYAFFLTTNDVLCFVNQLNAKNALNEKAKIYQDIANYLNDIGE
jgi:hypothetical protein